MSTRKSVDQVQPGAILMSWQDVVKVIVAGALAGILTMALYVLLDRYVFTPTLCSDMNAGTGRCDNRLLFSSGVALVVAAFPVLFYFVNQRIYRPLLVVIVSIAALWNVPLLIGELSLSVAILVAGLLFAGIYLLMAWLVQVRNFLVALGLSVIVVVVLRLILAS